MSSAAKKPRFGHNKPKKSKYRPKKKNFIQVGQRGFFATCNFQEKDCVRECYNLLNSYADELYGPEEGNTNQSDDSASDVESEHDIADNLQKEIQKTNQMKQNKQGQIKRRFTYLDSGANNCLFIRALPPVQPTELGIAIVKDIAEKRLKKTRHLLRLIPIEVVCHADITDIVKHADPLFDKHFIKPSSTFSIIYNKRFNNTIKRDAIIDELAKLVQSKNAANSVNLREPERTVMVEIIKGLCLLSVVENYLKYKKYNLVELAEPTVKMQTSSDETNKIDSTGIATEVIDKEQNDTNINPNEESATEKSTNDDDN